MKNIIKAGTVGLSLIGTMVGIAWLETQASNEFIIMSLSVMLGLFLFALVARIAVKRSRKANRKYQVANVIHEGPKGGYSLYTVTMNGFGKVLDYAIQEPEFNCLSEYQLQVWQDGMTLYEAELLIKEEEEA